MTRRLRQAGHAVVGYDLDPDPTDVDSLAALVASRQADSPAMKLVAALRREFGGHAVTATLPPGHGEAGEPGGEQRR